MHVENLLDKNTMMTHSLNCHLLAYHGLRLFRGRKDMFIEKRMNRAVLLMSEDNVGLQHNEGF